MNAINSQIDDPRALLATRDLIAVSVRGDDARRRMHGARTTFVRVFEVHVDAPPAAVPSGVAAGEVRIIGRPATESAAVEAVRAAAGLARSLTTSLKSGLTSGGGRRIPVTGFSLADLRALSASAGSLAALCSRLHDVGLEVVAETPIDVLAEAAEAVRAARDGGLEVLRLTVHAISHEDVDQRIAIVERARDLQRAVGGFRAFAPLPRTMSIATPTTGYDDVKQIALARVVVTNIDSIQVDWPLYGPKLAQVALTTGADDVDGISAVDGGALGTRRSPIEEIKGNIRAAALEAVERNGRFELVD
jgi:aminodeoxyfutalosine synthase